MNVFHAGDGNLHPLLVFDAREPGVLDRVHAAGAEIVAASLAAGGVLSGEHGIGLEKRDFMPLQFYRRRPRPPGPPAARLRPRRRREPGQGAARRGELRRRPAPRPAVRAGYGCDARAVGRVFVDQVGACDGCVAGGRAHKGVGGSPGPARARARAVGDRRAPPAEMTVRVGAGTTLAALDAALGPHGQTTVLDGARHATVGGVLATGHDGIRRLASARCATRSSRRAT